MSIRSFFAILLLTHLRLVSADEVRDVEPNLVEEIRKLLPADWECHFEPGAGTKYAPAGLNRPDFVVLITNPKLVVHREQRPKRGLLEINPFLPLSFYPIAQKEEVLKTIERQRMYSWAIPSYFGETSTHIVVTSPAWVNGGRYSLESRKSLRMTLIIIRTLITDKEERSNIVQMLFSDRPDGT